jgi:hypothetical protein
VNDVNPKPRDSRKLNDDSLCQQKQANLFLGSDHFTEMKTIMDNRHTAKRSQTHETIEVAC